MTTDSKAVHDEIAALEERLRLAELAPDPAFFEAILADDVVLSQNGNTGLTKQDVVAGHQPAGGPKFTSVETRDLKIVAHGDTAIATCEGVFTPPGNKAVSLHMLRVWQKRAGGWQIIAASIYLAPQHAERKA